MGSTKCVAIFWRWLQTEEKWLMMQEGLLLCVNIISPPSALARKPFAKETKTELIRALSQLQACAYIRSLMYFMALSLGDVWVYKAKR